jgi:MFS family permease
MMRTLQALPRGIWSLGLVSLFMDISSEMSHSVLPVFLVSVLGVSTVSLGIIEGVAEASAAIVKVFSGAISDWLGRRSPLSRGEIVKLPRRYWSIVVFAAVLTLARFSEAFLLLRAENLDLAVTWIPADPHYHERRVCR